MKFSIQRDELLKALSLLIGVVERRQTLAVLANILFVLKDNQLSLTATDTEVEISSHLFLQEAVNQGEEIRTTIPAKKLLDICKSLPSESLIQMSLVDNNKVEIACQRSRFVLSTLPAVDFPNVPESEVKASFPILQGQLRQLIDRTGFAMAHQDVRFYLNGLLFEVSRNKLRMVATDGHRLALSDQKDNAILIDETVRVIVPRKGVQELARVTGEEDKEIQISIGHNHLTAATKEFTLITKLIDGSFPEYQRVLPKVTDNIIVAPRAALKEAFNRAAILSNEKYRGIRLELNQNLMAIHANNPEQEEAEDSLPVEYQGESFAIGFNVSYLIDVLSVLDGDQVKFSLADSNSSVLIEDNIADNQSMYVVMPMRL